MVKVHKKLFALWTHSLLLPSLKNMYRDYSGYSAFLCWVFIHLIYVDDEMLVSYFANL